MPNSAGTPPTSTFVACPEVTPTTFAHGTNAGVAGVGSCVHPGSTAQENEEATS